MVVDNCGKVNGSVTQDVVPESERERGCIASRDETFVCSFRVVDVDASEYEHFLGGAEIV